MTAMKSSSKLSLITTIAFAGLFVLAANNLSYAGSGNTSGFVNNNDGTITDNSTGLTWAADAGTPTAGTCMGGKMSWQAAQNYVDCLNTKGYLGHSDWRLPTSDELVRVAATDSGKTAAESLALRGFVNAASAFYWSSTKGSGDIAYAVDTIFMPYSHLVNVANPYNVLPVR